jgi:hypothetical protein
VQAFPLISRSNERAPNLARLLAAAITRPPSEDSMAKKNTIELPIHFSGTHGGVTFEQEYFGARPGTRRRIWELHLNATRESGASVKVVLLFDTADYIQFIFGTLAVPNTVILDAVAGDLGDDWQGYVTEVTLTERGRLFFSRLANDPSDFVVDRDILAAQQT